MKEEKKEGMKEEGKEGRRKGRREEERRGKNPPFLKKAPRGCRTRAKAPGRTKEEDKLPNPWIFST
jgi:hypothetical protein